MTMWEAPVSGDLFWIDEVGDRLEREGVDPGNIWEVDLTLGDDLRHGAVIETSCAPGEVPSCVQQLKRVIVLKEHGLHGSSELIEMPWNRPLVLANWQRISSNMM